MKFFIAAILIATGIVSSLSQVEGVVVEKSGKNLSPIIGADLHWLESGNKSVSDENGKFSIKREFNDVHLIISAIGFENDTLIYNNQEFISVVFENSSLLDGVEVLADAGMLRLKIKDPYNVLNMDQHELRKAACCNLAESFETNPSIDAVTTDAVTGTKQLKMLGLSGKYVQIMQDNVPAVRGLSSIYGLEYYPGAWINGIQVSKGAGSVANGYESITGQINLNLKNPDNAEKIHLNVYGNGAGRLEGNGIFSGKVNERWSSTLLLHGKNANIRWDQNNDGFMDNPLSSTIAAHNQWNFRSENLHMEIGAGVTRLNAVAGQLDFDKDINSVGSIYGVHSNQEMYSGFVKMGYLYPNEAFKSTAIQIRGSLSRLDNMFDAINYTGDQESVYINLIHQDEFGASNKLTYRTGLSLVYDQFKESLSETDFNRKEVVPGAYYELTYNPNDKSSLIAGVRADYHNLFGLFATPRLHFRQSFGENFSLKIAAGRGQRTPNALAENIGYFASNRLINLPFDTVNNVLDVQPEVAWNLGLNLTGKFEMFYRPANLIVDFYSTRFSNKLIVDLEKGNQVDFYNLNGVAFSNSAQVELETEPFKRFKLRLAYRFLDVKADYRDLGLLSLPMVSQHRGFANAEYVTRESDKGGKWLFDATAQYIGKQRLPNTSFRLESNQSNKNVEGYVLLSSQITKVFNENFEIYLGGENLLNFRQDNPIISAEDPFAEDFDASLVWAPIFGRMFYGGLRFTIK